MYSEEVSDQDIIDSLLTKDSAKSDFISLFKDTYQPGISTDDDIKKIIAISGYQPDAAMMEELGMAAQEPSARLD
jgi:hypothetical protein